MSCTVKICGLKSTDGIDAALAAGADMVGFVFFRPSPRSLSVKFAAELAARVPDNVIRVALSVDADDKLLESIIKQVGVDMMQFHGKESPERITEVRRRFDIPIIKALAISGPKDVADSQNYVPAADQLMFDAKPPKHATRPGGNAKAFDWTLIANKDWGLPWILAGGLTPENVAEAIVLSGAQSVDVSSGVEDANGNKDAQKIFAFIDAVKSADLG